MSITAVEIMSLRIGGTYVEDEDLALKLLSAGTPNWLSALDCSGP